MVRIHKPFKGAVAYEWQIGNVVLQVPFKRTRHYPCWDGHKYLHVWRVR